MERDVGSSQATTLHELIPQSLGQVFRRNRDIGQLTLATDEELALLSAHVDDDGVRHTLDAWQIINICLCINGQTQVSPRLTGCVRGTGAFWMTSHVVQVDLNRGLVRTRNSTYRVAGERVGEDKLNFPGICATLNTWGIGQHFDVPAFFF